MRREVRLVQTWYPQIYLACHTSHRTRRASPDGLTARDSSVLAHLDERHPVSPGELARHLGIGKPAVSAAVKRLVRLGYIRASANAADRRIVHLRLTPAGSRAMRANSVLDAGRVTDLLRELDRAERRRALAGLELLAKAARQVGGQANGRG